MPSLDALHLEQVPRCTQRTPCHARVLKLQHRYRSGHAHTSNLRPKDMLAHSVVLYKATPYNHWLAGWLTIWVSHRVVGLLLSWL